MSEYIGFDQGLIDEAIDIRWLIFKNKGNACKSSVEDVLMKRDASRARHELHELMNDIEYYQLDGTLFLRKYWNISRPEPIMEDYPQIMECDIRWYE